MTQAFLMRTFNRSLDNLSYGTQVFKIEEVQKVDCSFLRRVAMDVSYFEGSETVYISAHDDQGETLFHLDKNSLVVKSAEEESGYIRSKSIFCHLTEYGNFDLVHHFVVYRRILKDHDNHYDDDEMVCMYVVEGHGLKTLIDQEIEYVKEAVSTISPVT